MCYCLSVDNFETVPLDESNKFHASVKKLIDKVKEEKEKEKEEIDSTDKIIDTIKSPFEEFITFFQKGIEDKT